MLSLWETKSFPKINALGQVQRVYPNTHCSGIGKSKGLQWAGANATLVLINESCENVELVVYDIILNDVGSRLNLER